MGEEVFNLDGILDASQIDSLGLFEETDYEEPAREQEKNTGEEPDNKKTTEVRPEELFGDLPESVGSGTSQGNQGKQDSELSDETPSPQNSVYSSIAKACYEDDVFPDLDESDINEVVDADTFKELLEKQMNARLGEVQKRISEALQNGVQPSDIQKYEGSLNYLNSITEEMLSEETDQGEDLRKRILFQDYLNRGFSEQRAAREVKKALDNGTDIEDAKEALQSNKEFYQGNYDRLLKQAKANADKVRERQTKEAQELRESIEKDNYLGDINLDKTTRRKIFDVISKPKHRDKDTGTTYTELQQYEMEHKADYLKYVGTLYTITDGFKNFDRFVNGKVKKEVNKSIKELESKLANTTRNSDGNLTFVGGIKDDDLSPFAKGWKLDI